MRESSNLDCERGFTFAARLSSTGEAKAASGLVAGERILISQSFRVWTQVTTKGRQNTEKEPDLEKYKRKKENIDESAYKHEMVIIMNVESGLKSISPRHVFVPKTVVNLNTCFHHFSE